LIYRANFRFRLLERGTKTPSMHFDVKFFCTVSHAGGNSRSHFTNGLRQPQFGFIVVEWEYRKIYLNSHHRRGEDIDLLSEVGQAGWELVTITANSVAYLRRAVRTTQNTLVRRMRWVRPSQNTEIPQLARRGQAGEVGRRGRSRRLAKISRIPHLELGVPDTACFSGVVAHAR